MQVKKFEAKSMREALQLVKSSMGPEAIILSMKDIRNGYGLAGGNSVEVTAAVSQQTLEHKKIAQAKLNQKNKAVFESSSARQQKEFIDKVVASMQNKRGTPARITATPYIDIEDDIVKDMDIDRSTSSTTNHQTAESRIRNAAREALQAAYTVSDEVERHVEPESVKQNNDEIESLKRQIVHLQRVISDFKNVPQTFISMHPGANEGVPFELSFMFEKLTRAGITASNAVEILRITKKSLDSDQLKKKALVNAWVAKFILDHIQIAENRLANRYHIFVGPSGQGKTSTLVKLASHLVIRKRKRVAIVSTDSKKVGASEQLRIYSQILNVPFCEINQSSDWNEIDKIFAQYDHVLVDFPGLSLKTVGQLESLKSMLPPDHGGRSIHYVVSALAKDEDAIEIAHRYQPIGLTDVIFTGLDESIQHGIIYNFQKEIKIPLHSFGIGPQLPEDFEPATKERVVDLIFKLTNIKKERGHS